MCCTVWRYGDPTHILFMTALYIIFGLTHCIGRHVQIPCRKGLDFLNYLCHPRLRVDESAIPRANHFTMGCMQSAPMTEYKTPRELAARTSIAYERAAPPRRADAEDGEMTKAAAASHRVGEKMNNPATVASSTRQAETALPPPSVEDEKGLLFEHTGGSELAPMEPESILEGDEEVHNAHNSSTASREGL